MPAGYTCIYYLGTYGGSLSGLREQFNQMQFYNIVLRGPRRPGYNNLIGIPTRKGVYSEKGNCRYELPIRISVWKSNSY